MSDLRPGFLSLREVQQLQLSLQSRSIREVALTVCTIRNLAVEVKSILRDLFHEDVTPSMTNSRPPDSSFMPMPPPDPFSKLATVHGLPTLTAQPYPSFQKSGFMRLMPKRVRRRHRCTHCPRTFTAQSSVWRHMKSHHTGGNSGDFKSSSPTMPNIKPSVSISNSSPAADPSPVAELGSPRTVNDVVTDMNSHSSNQPDTSVATPRQTSVASDENMSAAAASPLHSSHLPSSPEDHLSPMPTIADMFNTDNIKPEPSEEYVARPLELDADMEIVTPMKPVFGDGDSSQSLSMSMMFPSPGALSITSREHEDRVRANIDAQLMDIPLDGMYTCSDCGWRSKSAMSMKSHMLSHKGILPFSCNICNYKTNKKHVLTRHYTIHTGEKPHKCPICSFGSLDHVELLKHMTKTHPGVHPFTCTICGHHTTTNTLLKKHMKLDHSMSVRKQPSPSSSRGQPSEVHSSSSNSPLGCSMAKIPKVRNVLSSSSETIYATATTSINQPVFP